MLFPLSKNRGFLRDKNMGIGLGLGKKMSRYQDGKAYLYKCI